jgi:catechol 2,3-dioxygenase-like lactoylglutathione lyase family enzyme
MADFVYHHCGVSVPDLEEAISWYGEVLGYAVERRFYIEAAQADAAMLHREGMRIELFEVAGAAPLPADRREPPADLRTHGNKHAAFQVEDLDRFLAEMHEKGADVAMIVRESFGRGCFVRDCAGNLMEFVEKPSTAPSSTASPPAANA